MAIDLPAIDMAATGNPNGKVIVRKAWLREVHRKLVAAERAEGELARMKRSNDIFGAVFGQNWPG